MFVTAVSAPLGSDSPVEEHECTGVIQLVHLVEIRHLGNVDEVHDGEVLHLFMHTPHRLVHQHAFWVVVVPKTNADDSVFFTEDGLVNMPPGVETGVSEPIKLLTVS